MTDTGSEMLLANSPQSTQELEPMARLIVLTTAETAECTCPEFCERDHDVD